MNLKMQISSLSRRRCRRSRACRRMVPFTLIELMIVVVIIAALAAAVAPRLTGRAEQSRIAIATADIELNIANALKLYELDNGHFPTTEQGLEALLTRPGSDPRPLNWQGPYLEKQPIDPWGNRYQYRQPGSHNPHGYDLFSVGPDGVAGTEDDVANWN